MDSFELGKLLWSFYSIGFYDLMAESSLIIFGLKTQCGDGHMIPKTGKSQVKPREKPLYSFVGYFNM